MLIAQSYDWILPELKEFRYLCITHNKLPEDLKAKMLRLEYKIKLSGNIFGYFDKNKLQELLPEVEALMSEIKAYKLQQKLLE